MATQQQRIDSLREKYNIGSQQVSAQTTNYITSGEASKEVARSIATAKKEGAITVDSLREKYGIKTNLFSEKDEDEKTRVTDWLSRYNDVVKKVLAYDKKRNGGYTTDASGGYLADIEALIAEYEEIRNLARGTGLMNAGKYIDNLKEIQSTVSGINEKMSQFKDDADYKSYLAEVEEYEKKKNLDTDAYSLAIKQLEEQYDTLIDPDTDIGDMTWAQFDKEVASIEKELDERKAYLREAQLVQDRERDRARFDAIRENADFDQFSSFDPSNQEFGYQYVNADTASREALKEKYGAVADEQAYNSFDNLNDEEKEMYNYLMNTGDRQGAYDYMKYLQPDLNYRKAQETFQDGYDDAWYHELVFGMEAGLDQARSGMQGFHNLVAGKDEYVPASYKQQLSGMIREDLGEQGWAGKYLGQTAYDAITTTANMAPSILASTALSFLNPTAGAVAGQALLGMTASGNAYTEAINAGFSKDQARGYGLLVGASEIVLEKVLGGITGLGGNAAGQAMISNLNAADGAFKMVAKRLGGSMLSEFGEEYLQEVLSPVISNLTLGTHEDVNVLSADALYAGILGALTSFAMEGPFAALEASSVKNTGKLIQDVNAAERLAELGNTFSADTVAYQLAGKVNENTNAFTLGRLFNEIGASLSEQNTRDIANALITEGMPPETARKNAKVLGDLMEGKKVSRKQRAMIESNDILARAAVDVLINENTTANQRISGYNQVAQAMVSGTNMDGGRSVQSPAATASKKEAVEKKQYDLGGTGKTTYIPDGKEVRIKEIASIKDGKMMLKLTDGRTVDAADVHYGSDSEALVYEAVKEMGATAQAANVFVNGFKAVQKDGITASAYAHGLDDAYRYGKLGVPLNTVKENPFIKALNPGQLDYAWRQGRKAVWRITAMNEAKVRRPAGVTAPGKGGVYFAGRDGRISDFNSRMKNAVLKDVQESAVETMKVLSETLGLKFYVHESYRNKDGKLVIRDSYGKERSANGFYDPRDGSIHIDMNAGRDGQGTMLFTMSHEMTHFVRHWSPSKYQKLANFLVGEFSEKYGGETVDQLVHKKMKDTKLEYDDAFEEVVADAMETMLTDGNLVEKLAKLKKQDKTLWQRLKAFVKDWHTKLKKAYEGLTPDSAEGQMVAAMVDSIDQLQQLFAEGLVEASENYKAGQDKDVKEAEPVAMAASRRTSATERDLGSDVRYSRKADDDQYDVSGVHWGFEHGLISRAEARIVWEAIANITKRRYSYPKTVYGEHIISADKALFFVEVNYRYPSINKIIRFNENYEVNAGYAKEVIINAEGHPTRHREAVQDVEDTFGEGYVSEYDRSVYAADAGEDRGREGKNRRGNHQRDYEGGIKRSDRSDESVSNRSLLANALESATVNDKERQKLQEYKEKIGEIQEAEEKLRELNAQIRDELNHEQVKKLRIEARQTLNRLEILDRQILRKEAELKPVLDREQKMAYLRGDQKRKNAYDEYKINREAAQLKTIREYRATREELLGLKDDTKIIEKEFIRIVKAFEKQTSKDAKTISGLRKRLSDESKKHTEDVNLWAKEFTKLMKEYEAAGKDISRLEAKIEHQRNAAKRNVDGRKRTILRNKIRKDIRELDKILNHGNKKRNVKQGMQDMVAEAIRSGEVLFADIDSDIDMVMAGMLTDMSADEQRLYEDAKRRIRLLNPNGDKTAEEIQAFLKQHPNNELQKVLDKLHHAFERERIRINNTQASEAFQSLADAYESLKDSNDQYIAMAFNENVLDHLKMLKRKTEGTLVKDMDQKQLQALHDGYKMIMKTIREANKAFVDGRSIQADAEQLVAELEKVKKPDRKAAIALQNVFNSVGWDYEKFYYALERINSPTLKRLFGNLAESENITMRDVQEAKEFQANAVEKYHYNDWDIDKKIDHTFVDNNGKKFQLTLGEMLSLYAYSRREGADKHIEVGGFTFGKKALTDPKPADTYKLTADQVAKITSMLTPEQKSFAEAMQKFLTEVMGEKGNEVTMKLYGIKLYTEENYWPLHIAGEYKVKAQESKAQAAEGFKTMANAGFTHARNMESTAPIVLEGFMDVWADHVNEMSRYHGAVPALEDIRRVMNYSVYSEASSESVSVTAALTNAYGKNAVEYFDSLYREANSGAVREKMVTAPAKALSLFRKGAVAYSLSVIIQQPASIHRAKMLVDSKYFGKHGMFTLTSGTLRILNRNKWNASYAEMMKYAPGVTMAKEIGGFDTSTGSSIRRYLLDTEKTAKQEWKHGTAKQKAGAVLGIVDDNIIANLPNVADKIAWIEMWEACKREVHAKNHNLSPVTEEFMQKVGERFTEVVRATQVYDSMFSKSPMLNSKNTFVQSMVSFMNEPNTVANMAEDAVRKFARGEKRQALKTAGALITSIVSTNVLKSIIYAMRDDDEDETFWEKYVSAFAGNLINDFNPANYIPGARDYVSIKQGYDVERTDMAIIADVVKAAQALKDLANKDTSNMTEKELEKHDKKLTDAQWRMAETLAVFAGIPLKNIRRDVLAIANTVKTSKLDKNRESTDLSVRLAIQEALQGSEFSANKLYEAIVSGDKELERRIRSEYDKENEYRSAVRKALRENDQRITEAAKAWNSNDLETYQRLADEIIAEGKFSKTDVREAINTKANSLDKTEKEPTPEKEKGLFNAEKFAVAISQDNADMADAIRNDIIETAKINGSDSEDAEKSFNSSAKSALKKLYLDKGVTAEQAEKALRDYCDVGSSEAEQLIRDWDFEEKHDKSFSEMFNEYEKGNVTERDIRAAMKEIGMKEYEIAEKLRSTQENKAFQNKFKMTFSEARDLYMDGQLNKNKMREMLIYDGKTQMQADDTLREWDVAKKFDIPYDKLDDAYKYGDISRQQLYSAMIAVGETPKNAEEALACYDWLKARVKEHPDLQISDARKFVTSISDTCDEAEDYTLTDYGISVNTYKQYKTVIADAHGVDEDGDGQTDDGTLRESKFNIINSMSLSKSQKDALAMISYSMKSIRRYAPWH